MHAKPLAADLTLGKLREFTGLACRPEEVRPGSLFFAFSEFLRYNEWVDGNTWIEAAISAGAKGLVAHPLPEQAAGLANITLFAVADPRKSFATTPSFSMERRRGPAPGWGNRDQRQILYRWPHCCAWQSAGGKGREHGHAGLSGRRRGDREHGLHHRSRP